MKIYTLAKLSLLIPAIMTVGCGMDKAKNTAEQQLERVAQDLEDSRPTLKLDEKTLLSMDVVADEEGHYTANKLYNLELDEDTTLNIELASVFTDCGSVNTFFSIFPNKQEDQESNNAVLFIVDQDTTVPLNDDLQQVESGSYLVAVAVILDQECLDKGFNLELTASQK